MTAPQSQRHIVAMGGGGFSMEPENPVLDDYVLSLARGPRPRVCFLAPMDSDDYFLRFYAAFAKRDCRPAHLSLFYRDGRDLESFLLGQDVIYVGGGNTANMLAIWAGSAKVNPDDWTAAMLPSWVADEVPYGNTTDQQVVESVDNCIAYFAAGVLEQPKGSRVIDGSTTIPDL